MKSEHSQAQESDLLADRIEQRIAQLKPYLPALLILIGLAVLGMLGYGIYASQLETRAARGWTDFYFSDTQPQNLEAISKDFADTSAGSWARLTAGDANMSKAMEKWNIDRNLSDQFFQQAFDDYRVVAGTTSEPFARSRAVQGMAQALEGLGDRNEAIAEYKKLAAMSVMPADLLAEINNRIQWLESRGGEAFYNWYASRRVNPAVPAGDRPFPNLPSLPDIQFPPTGGVPGSSSGAIPGFAPESTGGASRSVAPSLEPSLAEPSVAEPSVAEPSGAEPAAEPAPSTSVPAVEAGTVPNEPVTSESGSSTGGTPSLESVPGGDKP